MGAKVKNSVKLNPLWRYSYPMPRNKSEFFTSRWGFVLSMLGIAVGAGNIWRFSRVVAQNGGGSFLIPWILFLFIWSIPLILAEIALGKMTRRGPIGALIKSGGPKMAWMGAFIALVTTGILFYYSVVVGWGFRYLVYAFSGKLTMTTNHVALWESYTRSWEPFVTHIAAISIGAFVIFKGVVHGIEKSNKILIPTLLIIIFAICLRAITLPGAWSGIRYFFTPHMADLLNYQVWIAALTQNAWDTGAGWGLLLVYAGYARKQESITVNGCLTAFGNNFISIVMGITIFATAFALLSNEGIEQLISGEGATNTGLTFIFLPKLFSQLPGGATVHITIATLFFLAFSFAALSSLISMIQLTTQTISELGISKNRALIITSLLALILGAPSALNMAVFENQDWVWSLGLIVSGLFIAIGIVSFGVERFRTQMINSVASDFRIGKFYGWILGLLVPLQALFLIGWYVSQSTKLYSDWWNPLHMYSLGTIILQWGLGIIAFLLLNNWFARRTE